MDYPRAMHKLLLHASRAFDNEPTPDASLTYAIWQYRTQKKGANFIALYRDVLDCLEVVNHQINGTVPSETTQQGAIDAKLAIAVSAILDDGWNLTASCLLSDEEETETTRLLTLISWAISRAWTCILEGDIDSLSKAVENAAAVAGLPIEWLSNGK